MNLSTGGVVVVVRCVVVVVDDDGRIEWVVWGVTVYIVSVLECWWWCRGSGRPGAGRTRTGVLRQYQPEIQDGCRWPVMVRSDQVTSETWGWLSTWARRRVEVTGPGGTRTTPRPSMWGRTDLRKLSARDKQVGHILHTCQCHCLSEDCLNIDLARSVQWEMPAVLLNSNYCLTNYWLYPDSSTEQSER